MTPITTRPARDSDRARCIEIEANAIQGIRYIDDNWDLFTGAGDGDLTMALWEGTVGGMGKLTHLFGRFCWLESLRVHPDYQNRGLGKALYARYFEEMRQRGLSACGMYTGYDNSHSRHLAQLFGLRLAGRFAEYTAPVAPPATAPVFTRIPQDEGEAALAELYPRMGGFAVLNRTWFPAISGLGEALASRGWLWRGEGGTLLVAGSRFQPRKALHVPFFCGDAQAAVAHAHRLALEAGAAALTAVRPHGDTAAEAALLALGFTRTGHDNITLWKDL